MPPNVQPPIAENPGTDRIPDPSETQPGPGNQPQIIYPQSFVQPVPPVSIPYVPPDPQPVVYTDPLVAQYDAPQGVIRRLLRWVPKHGVLAACLVLAVFGMTGAVVLVASRKPAPHVVKPMPVIAESTKSSKLPVSQPQTKSTPTNTTTQPSTTQTPVVKTPSATTTPKSGTATNTAPSTSGTSAPSYTISEEPPYNAGNVTFYYTGASQMLSGGTGVSVDLTQAAPTVPYLGTTMSDHSLMEVAASFQGDYNYVEIGWMVDSIFNDNKPRLFVGRWIDGDTCQPQPTGCGFVQVSSANTPQEVLNSSGTANFKISFSNGDWDLYYNGDEVGYFPESLWGSGYDSLTEVQVYGEVLQQLNTSSCIQMGNGISGPSLGSAQVSDYTLLGSSQPAAFSSFYETAADNYRLGSPTATGFGLGGPGVC